MTRFQRRPWILAVLLSGCVVSAAACASGSSESGEPSLSAGSTTAAAVEMSGGYEVGADGKLLKPSDAPVPVKPSPPTVMSSDTPEGAEAFARYFVEMTEYAWNTGDTDTLREISNHDCEWCSGIINTIEEKYLSGGWVLGLRYDISSVESPILFPNEDGKYAVVVNVKTSDHDNYDGVELKRLTMQLERVELHECWLDTDWIVFGGLGSDNDEGA